MEFIGQHLKPNRAREAKAQILAELALVQPLAAAKHLETLELSQQFTHLYHRIATGLAAEDLDQALAWIQGLDNKRHQSMAIQGVMQQIPLEDSERIEKVLASLARPQDRLNATSQLVSTHA